MSWFSGAAKKETPAKAQGTTFLPKMTTISEVTENGELTRMTLTVKHFEIAFDKVNNDPRAGQGLYSKKEEFLNEVAKLLNTCDLPEAKPVTPEPLMSEPKQVAPRQLRSVKQPAPSGLNIPPIPADQPLDLRAPVSVETKA